MLLTISPYATHVLTSDTIAVHHDPVAQRLHVTKLILKKGRLPQWSTRFLKNITESWILEESIVDLTHLTMWTRTCNMDHRKVLGVEELQQYTAHPSTPKSHTLVHYNTAFKSNLSMFSRPVEKFSFNKYAEGGAKARKGMVYILERLSQGRIAWQL